MSQSTSQLSLNSKLLGDNASPLERSLEYSLTKNLNDIQPPYPALKNADSTPIHMLPYLAADRMVTYWKQADSTAIKRKQVKVSNLERKISGTRGGIAEALDAIGYGCEVRNQYDIPELPPFTLDVIAWKEDSSPVNPELIKQLFEKLEDIKSTRDTIDIALVFGVETEIALCGAKAPPTNVSYTDAPAELWPMPDASLSLGIAGGVCPSITVNHLTVKATVIPDKPMAYPVIAAGSYSLSVSPITARAIHE